MGVSLQMDKDESDRLEIICNEKIENALKAAYVALDDTGLQDKIRDESHHHEVLNEYDLPQAALIGLLEIVNKMDFLINKQPTPNRESKEEKILYEPFDHIRWSYFISMGMSIIVFAVGVLFLAIALKEYFSEGTISTSTIKIAGLGIADFVLVFYSRPWRDISINLSNSQKMRMIAATYLAGMSLINLGDMKRFEALQSLTKSSVNLVNELAKAERSQDETPRNEEE
jgi:hypothetical protein